MAKAKLHFPILFFYVYLGRKNYFHGNVILTLSRRQDVSNVNFLPSTHADRTFQTSPPSHPLAPTVRSKHQFRNVKFGKLGVRGFSIIMRAQRERVNANLA